MSVFKECCGKCKYNVHDVERRHGMSHCEYYCENPDSENYGCITDYSDTCDGFEDKDVDEN